MTAIEAAVVFFGLFLGFWLVSMFMGGEPLERKDGAAWFEVLNVTPGASLEDIQAAYRTLSAQYAPGGGEVPEDIRKLAEARRKEIDAAWQEALRVRGGGGA